MDWRLCASTFALIFLAELGDKTQLAALAASAGARSPWSVFLGASSALVITTLIAVLVGSALQQVLPVHYLKLGAAVLFLVFGVLLLVNALRSSESARTAAPLHIKEGLLTRFILAAARDFETASSAHYAALARSHVHPHLRDMMSHLAEEERQHLHSLSSLSREHETTPWQGESLRAIAPPDITAQPEASAEAIVSEALAHENATEQFYRGLALKAHIASLRAVFTELADSEASHAAHLKEFLETGRFSGPQA